MRSYMFPLDGEAHCNEWLQNFWIVIATVGGIAVLILIGNVTVELMIQYGSYLTRPVNEQVIVKNAIRAISWIQFINLGLILFVINISFKIAYDFKLPEGIFQGEFEDFSSMWYVEVGT